MKTITMKVTNPGGDRCSFDPRSELRLESQWFPGPNPDSRSKLDGILDHNLDSLG